MRVGREKGEGREEEEERERRWTHQYYWNNRYRDQQVAKDVNLLPSFLSSPCMKEDRQSFWGSSTYCIIVNVN